jgi:hypothetical protein
MAPLLARRKRASTAINEAQKKMCRTRFAGLSALSEADADAIAHATCLSSRAVKGEWGSMLTERAAAADG